MKNQKGFTLLIILLVIVVVLGLGVGVYYLGKTNSKTQKTTDQLVIQSSPSPSVNSDETANWKNYQDQWISFSYPPNLFVKNGSQYGDPHVVSLLNNQSDDYRNAEFQIDTSLRGDLSNYATALNNLESVITSPQIKTITNGVIITGTINNQMQSNLKVKIVLLKYGNGGLKLTNDQFSGYVTDQTFDQILSTFKFTDQNQTADLDQLKLACSKTTHDDPSKIIMTISSSKYPDQFLSGDYRVQDQGGGAIFLAAKVNGNWVCPSVGNGVPLCSEVDPYNFPVDSIPTCRNDNTLIDRSTHLPVK